MSEFKCDKCMDTAYVDRGGYGPSDPAREQLFAIAQAEPLQLARVAWQHERAAQIAFHRAAKTRDDFREIAIAALRPLTDEQRLSIMEAEGVPESERPAL